MELKPFCIYIGSFFACSVVLVAIVKQFAEGFAASGKKPIISGIFSSIIISGGAYLSTTFSDVLFPVFWLYTGIFLIFGMVHLLFFHDKYFSSNKSNKDKVLIGEILFCLALIFFTVVVFSSLQYFLEKEYKKETSFLYYPMLMSLIGFFIPLTVLHAFRAAYSIPPPEFSVWQYPIHDPIELPDERDGDKVLVIAFEIAKKKNDPVKTNFRARGPESMKLGDLYYHFINDYNDVQSETTIEYAENEDTAYEWWFHTKQKWYHFRRVLDPELSVRENKIKENSVIICERMENPEI